MTTPTPRPTPFHRQTTGFLENKTKRQHHTDDGHIDLASGLDIVLNMEVNQHDPAGITMPYRLLVPALRYEDEVGVVEQELMEELGVPVKKRWEGLGRGIGSVRRWSVLPTRKEVEEEEYEDEEEEDEESRLQGRREYDGVSEQPRGGGRMNEKQPMRAVETERRHDLPPDDYQSEQEEEYDYGSESESEEAEVVEDEHQLEYGHGHGLNATSRQPSVRQTPGQVVGGGKRAKW